MLEDTLKLLADNIAAQTQALKENTAALVALKGEGCVASSAASAPAEEKPKRTKKTEAAAETPKVEVKTTPKETTVSRDDIRNHITNERKRLKEQVSDAAAAKHKDLTRDIVSKAGGTSITDIPEAKLAEVFAALKAIDVNADSDEDGDGDDL